MKVAKKPANEKERIEALHDYDILDSLPEKDFDDLTILASQLCNVPIALISLIDVNRQWFKSKVGMEATETARDPSFCSHAILEDGVTVVPNSTLDDRFSDNPFVTGAPHVRFYAGAPLKSPQGLHLGTLCVIDSKPRDLTPAQIHALEALARQAVNQMELRRSLRLLQESQQALNEAKDVAETAYKVKGEFLANMSHEIRTPMNGIIGLTELLQGTRLDSDQQEKLRMIQSCGQSLLELINEILDFSKLEAGKVQIEKRDFNFKELITDTMKLCDVIASKKGLKLNCNIDTATPGFINGDSARIRQVLMNLLGNALKFTSVGEVTIHVKHHGLPQGPTSEIQVSVQDTGPGIPTELQHRLFKSFSQVDASTTRQFGGTGLGLAISKGLCEKMDGRIWFDTVPKIGSTFHFTFKAEACEGLANVKSGSDEITYVPTPLKILVAEDNRINQTVIVGLLSQFGHEIDVAENGRDALTMLAKKAYDVLFLDCHMPQLDGFETTKLLLANPSKYGRPQIVALTASVLEEDKKRCFASGMDEFLSKPVRGADLKRILTPIQKLNANKKRPVSPSVTTFQKAGPMADQAANPTTSEVNLQNFYKAFAAIEHIMGTVIKQFLQDYPVILQQIHTAIQSGNFKSLHVSAHSLKGMLAEIYAADCQKLAYDLEQMGKSENTAQAQTTYQTLSEKLKNVEVELKQIKSIPKAA